MFAELVHGTPLVAFPIAGLVLFFTFMVVVYWWAYLPSRKQYYQNIGASILRD